MDEEKYFRSWIFSIVRKYSANLRTSVLRDFENILIEYNLLGVVKYNKSDKTFMFWSRIVEFIGVDDAQKARWPRRDILYCNEANELSYEDYFQLSIRTRYKIFIDFNPDDEDVWINTELEMKRQFEEKDVNVIISTYLDNPFLDPIIVHEIERLKQADPVYWAIYGEGKYGKLTGLVFKFEEIDWVPEGAKFLWYGQDFWFTNDPSALVAMYLYDRKIIYDEVFYLHWLTNIYMEEQYRLQSITGQYEANEIRKVDDIMADAAEPKAIEEISRAGYRIKAATKGKDSIMFGIDSMKQLPILITTRSVNLKKEFRKYTWKVDKTGKPLNEPIDAFNHAIDAARYITVMKLPKQNQKKKFKVMTSQSISKQPQPVWND